jgi:hypothetical protein
VNEAQRAVGGIIARFPEIPAARYGVDREERAESKRDGRVRRLKTL